MRIKISKKLCLLRVVCGLICAIGTAARAGDHAGVNLFTVGDWGIDSPDRQAVADAMARRAGVAGDDPDAVLLLGDNFYVQLTSV